jgi:periodic tryptophan protein 2
MCCSVVETVIEGRQDAAGGRRTNDARTAKSSTRGKCFTSVCYSADGTCMLAGGLSKYVCIYAISPRLLLRKYQLSHNRSLEGVLDKLSSAGVKEGGLLADVDASGSDDEKDKKYAGSPSCFPWSLSWHECPSVRQLTMAAPTSPSPPPP